MRVGRDEMTVTEFLKTALGFDEGPMTPIKWIYTVWAVVTVMWFASCLWVNPLPLIVAVVLIGIPATFIWFMGGY